MPGSSYTENALRLLKYLPRVSLQNVKNHWKRRRPPGPGGGQYMLKRKIGYGDKGMLQRQKFLPAGYTGKTTPFYLTVPVEDYYRDVFTRRQYPPFTLRQLQLMTDNKRLNPYEPIDVCSICASHHYHLDPKDNQYGIQLTDDGIDVFQAKVNIEVQHASQQVIAAIEKNGGIIRTAYYDILSLSCIVNPKAFFQKGEPIPRRLLPPPDCIEYYTDAKNRGYLADPEKIAEERLILAQKFGYELPDLKNDPQKDMLEVTKDPRQIFFGLEPGWLVNLKDRKVYKPSDKALAEYYSS